MPGASSRTYDPSKSKYEICVSRLTHGRFSSPSIIHQTREIDSHEQRNGRREAFYEVGPYLRYSSGNLRYGCVRALHRYSGAPETGAHRQPGAGCVSVLLWPRFRLFVLRGDVLALLLVSNAPVVLQWSRDSGHVLCTFRIYVNTLVKLSYRADYAENCLNGRTSDYVLDNNVEQCWKLIFIFQEFLDVLKQGQIIIFLRTRWIHRWICKHLSNTSNSFHKGYIILGRIEKIGSGRDYVNREGTSRRLSRYFSFPFDVHRKVLLF